MILIVRVKDLPTYPRRCFVLARFHFLEKGKRKNEEKEEKTVEEMKQNERDSAFSKAYY